MLVDGDAALAKAATPPAAAKALKARATSSALAIVRNEDDEN